MKQNLIAFFVCLAWHSFGQVTIKIDPLAEKKAISPYIYGRNNSVSSTDPNWKLADADLLRLRDAGVTFFRESTGNNCTKYNWRRKLSSHPDWYNNVYYNDWDRAAQTIQKNFPNAQGMWAFQLIGKAAKTATYNFKDWEYNKSQWWEGVVQNLAGNGVLNPTGTKAKVEGNADLYLENWPADSTVNLLDHWFSSKGLNLNKKQVQYWNMDNEPEIWSGTHDDLISANYAAEDFIQKYIAVAQKARAKFPDIKLVGPVTANEWQWYNWNNNAILNEGRNLPGLQFFIKRIAEEQKKSGVKLLDVLDIHFYPSTKKAEEIVQLHRVFFDKGYVFPEANGVYRVNGGWDTSQNKEYIFARINDWLNTYFGLNHNIKLGLTEIGIGDTTPSVTAVWYASTMGEFMKNEVEIFTPWSWKVGMWETLHLFSRFNQKYAVKGTSSDENLVSAYPSINATQDSMTVVLVNRSSIDTKNITINFDNFLLNNAIKILSIKSLPTTETFVSHTQNATVTGNLIAANNTIQVSLPAMSVVSLQFTGKIGLSPPATVLAVQNLKDEVFKVYPNPSSSDFILDIENQKFEKVEIIDLNGHVISTHILENSENKIIFTKPLQTGSYLIKASGKDRTVTKKIAIIN